MTYNSLIICFSLAAYAFSAEAKANTQKTVINGPQNDAIEWGPDVLLQCQASGPGEQVEWREYITSSNGAVISINDQTLPGHPNAARYSIEYNSDTVEYNLRISPTVLSDGGTYRCQDTSDGSRPAYAQLVTIDGSPNCTTNIPVDGTVMEGQYYTVECTVGYRSGNAAPVMTWTGPEDWKGTWGQATTTTNITVWSGVNMNMSRFFDMFNFSVQINFTDRGFVLPDSASNIPTWQYFYQAPELHVFWKPGRMYIVPEQTTYEIGDMIECWSDGNPIPQYFWQSGATNERWDGQQLTLRADMVGMTTFRCNAQNDFGSDDLFVQIIVNAPTTPTTPTTTTTTTPPPAEGPCYDLTGRWGATTPSLIDMCLEINSTSGLIVGLFRNATDPYFIEIRGKVTPGVYDEVGFVGVWPVNIGTQGFVGVCSNCHGTEYLQVTAIGRRIGDFNTCSDFGTLRLFQFYQFTRTGPPCRTLFKEYGITF